jgi:hypothetical protein
LYCVGHKASPQDLYETKPEITKLMIKTLQKSNINISEITIFEPACGNGAIVKELELLNAKVIARDLYTTDEKQDYLVCEDPQYDIMITNPPFALKYEFAKKAFASEKPFVMLLPICCLTTKRWMSNFGKQKVFIQMLSSCEFLQNNVSISVADCVWLYGNFKFITNTFEYVIVGDDNSNQFDSSELGSINGDI